jgi:hypothetical protein
MGLVHALRTAACCSALVVLTSCAPTVEATPPASSAPSAASPSATPTPVALEGAFAQPAVCRDLLPLSAIARLEGDGLALLGGPDGKFGDDYLSEPSPEQALGGITCIWGFESTEISSVTISVAPLSAATRPGVVANLTDQGLNSELDEDATVFWQQGDEDHEPAILNFLRAGSWISVIQTVGGPENYDEAELLASETFETVYG